MTISQQRAEGIGEQLRRGREEAARLRDDMREISDDLRALAEKEAALAKAEVKEQLGLSGRVLGLAAAALVFASIAAVFVFLTIMFLLWVAIPMWAAALVTTAILVACAGACGYMAYRMFKRVSMTPKRTIESLRQDVRWAKQQLNLNVR